MQCPVFAFPFIKQIKDFPLSKETAEWIYEGEMLFVKWHNSSIILKSTKLNEHTPNIYIFS